MPDEQRSNKVMHTEEQPRLRLSQPQQGRSLAAATEQRASVLRTAVALLVNGLRLPSLQSAFHAIFVPDHQGDARPSLIHSDLAARAAWSLVSMWLLAQSAGAIGGTSSLSDAEHWFLGSPPPTHQSLSSLADIASLDACVDQLRRLSLDQGFWDLLPYVLEPYGPGSRVSVLRDPSAMPTRLQKKRRGVFYTPADVADYMVRLVRQRYQGDVSRAKCLDPACGTGVFLLAMCRAAEAAAPLGSRLDRFDYIVSNLFGCDISPHAVDACAFVLLQYSLRDALAHNLTPWAAWRTIRRNLVVADSLTIAPPAQVHLHYSNTEQPQLRLFAQDAVGCVRRSTEPSHDGNGLLQLEQLFPAAARGFDILVANPPYSRLGTRPDHSTLAVEYQSLVHAQPAPGCEVFPLFIEMAWRLTVPGCSAAAIVTPLSVAYHRGAQYRACRRAMMAQGGRWDFAFFDREPHALFGEEVKTRNAILFRSENSCTPRRGQPARIASGPIQKWTSRSRSRLFRSITFTELGAVDITLGVPKLSGRLQLSAYATLRSRPRTFESFCLSIDRCTLWEATESEQPNLVFLGGTAYNFLNVFRAFAIAQGTSAPLSSSPVHRLAFCTEQQATAAFAILSSRLVFWLWLVEGDAFHVSSSFIRALPLDPSSFPPDQLTRLSNLGHHLWRLVQAHRSQAVNGGKRTYAFSPLLCDTQRDGIDEILVSACHLPPDLLPELRSLVRRTTIVDDNDPNRQHLLEQSG